MGGVTIGLIAFFLFLATRFNTTDMDLLYGNLDPEDRGKIVARLDSLGMSYELRENGSEIHVPAGRKPEIRMRLAEDGLPGEGAVGYEAGEIQHVLHLY